MGVAAIDPMRRTCQRGDDMAAGAIRIMIQYLKNN